MIDTEKSYLLGLLVGGGIIHEQNLQIILPYKNWGNLKVNPSRAGGIAEDILKRLNPLWNIHYSMNVSYRVGTNWKIIADSVSHSLIEDLEKCGLATEGELRLNSSLEKLSQYLSSKEHKRNFITGLVDTVGSLAETHRRFNNDFQIISFEFKGNNYELVTGVSKILSEVGCVPDQILWNHPNQHSGNCRYYNSWKKGFKIRVALDDYMLKGGFVFESKQLSARENSESQTGKKNTTKGKEYRVTGRVCLHKDQNMDWIPEKIRGCHFVHNLHFNDVLEIPTPNGFNIDEITHDYHNLFCPFTCLTKGTEIEIQDIIAQESYLKQTQYVRREVTLESLLQYYHKDKNALLFGEKDSDGFPITHILHAIAYTLSAPIGRTMGKRIRGNYIDVIEEHINHKVAIKLPDRGTCLLIENLGYAALIGYVNPKFNKSLLSKIEGSKVFIKEPVFSNCVILNYERS